MRANVDHLPSSTQNQISNKSVLEGTEKRSLSSEKGSQNSRTRSFKPGTRLFWMEIRRYLGAYLTGAFAIALTNATELAFPKFMQWGIDTVQLSSTSHVPTVFRAATVHDTLLRLTCALFAVSLIAILGRALWRQCLARRSHQSGYHLRKSLWDSLSQQPVKIFSQYPIGDLMNRCISDVNPARFVLGFTHVATWDIVFYTLLGTASLMVIDPLIAWCTIGVFFLLPFFLKNLVQREYVLHGEAQNLLSQLSDRIAQMVATARLQRSSAMESIWLKILSADARVYAAKQFEVEKTAWKCFPFGGAATFVCYVLIFSIGLPKVMSQELTVGQFVSAMSVVLLMQGPLFSLSDIIVEWQKGLASLNRVAEIIDLHPPIVLNTPQSAETMEIAIRNLSFSYDSNGSNTLNNFQLLVDCREVVGIAGEIGSGKSTLLHILAGLELVPPGCVKVRGFDVSSLSRDELTQMISLVPQKPFLFAGSIRDNLNLDQLFSDEVLWQILEEMRLADDFRTLKRGLDTPVGEWGISLSGGQRQRLALARALLRPKPILLLDDSLSAVDAITEEFILDSIKVRLTNSTVLWVSHRTSTLDLCDRVYRLSCGRLQPLLGNQIDEHDKLLLHKRSPDLQRKFFGQGSDFNLESDSDTNLNFLEDLAAKHVGLHSVSVEKKLKDTKADEKLMSRDLLEGDYEGDQIAFADRPDSQRER